MDTRTRRDLVLITHTMEYLANLPGQDLMLVIECGQCMIEDLLADDKLDRLAEYVKQYCDVLDNDAQAIEYETRIIASYAAS